VVSVPDLLRDAVRAVVATLDANDRAVGIPAAVAIELRVGKVHEEIGEAWAALIALWGQNPRKPRGNEADLRGELYDVALAALVAAESIVTVPATLWETYWSLIEEQVSDEAQHCSAPWSGLSPQELLIRQPTRVAQRAGKASGSSRAQTAGLRRAQLQEVANVALSISALMTSTWAEEFEAQVLAKTARLQAGRSDA